MDKRNVSTQVFPILPTTHCISDFDFNNLSYLQIIAYVALIKQNVTKVKLKFMLSF